MQVDLNRAGVPLLEIVSEPDMRNGIEAAEYAAELQRLVRYLGVGNGNMQEGSLRCDVNISVRPLGQLQFGTKVCQLLLTVVFLKRSPKGVFVGSDRNNGFSSYVLRFKSM